MSSKAMSDRVPIGQSPIPEPAEAPVLTQGIDEKLSYMDDIEFHRVADYFEVPYEDRKDIHVAEELSFLYDWAKASTKSDDRITRLNAIKQLKGQLGFTEVGKGMVKKLYQWTRLDQQRRRTEKEMDLITEKKSDIKP